MLDQKENKPVHFGRVHGLVEDFLPSRYHIALKSPRLARPKARNSGALEKTDKDAKKNKHQDDSFAKETGDACSPVASFSRESKRGSIELGRQKRNKTEEGMAKPDEESNSESEDSNKEEHGLYQSGLDGQFEEHNERSKDVEQQDLEDEDSPIFNEESIDVNEDDSIDVKDNILEYADPDARSPRSLLAEFLDGDLDDE